MHGSSGYSIDFPFHKYKRVLDLEQREVDGSTQRNEGETITAGGACGSHLRFGDVDLR